MRQEGSFGCTPIRASKTGKKPSRRPISSMGSLMTVPKMGTVALVTARPTNVNRAMNRGNPMAWPRICCF